MRATLFTQDSYCACCRAAVPACAKQCPGSDRHADGSGGREPQKYRTQQKLWRRFDRVFESTIP